jgi:2-C-methyl-D-erythritol 4-phosphate cytidylyltransferase/2-C-methyl-D-erythritol 2,4-cyclodiphosphate synthase
VAEIRVGLGFDAHPPEPGRLLRLGGIEFEGEGGLAGHSDGDAVSHALADALLGAGALGDLGQHFPEDDPELAGIGGLAILARVRELLRSAGLAPVSCDLVVIAERPRLAERRDEMRAALAEALGLGTGSVSVKATRPEGLGLAGEGIGCMAVAVVTDA